MRVGGGVVDQDVEAPEALQRGVDQALEVVRPAGVRGDGCGGAGMGVVDALRLRVEVGLFAAREDHFRAAIGERVGDRAADAAAGAGDYRHPVPEIVGRHRW